MAGLAFPVDLPPRARIAAGNGIRRDRLRRRRWRGRGWGGLRRLARAYRGRRRARRTM